MIKPFKTMLTLSLAVLLSSATLFAQKNTEKGKQKMSKEQKEQKFAEMSKRLSLSTEQETKLKSIITQNRAEMKTLREANKETPKEEKRKLVLGQLKKADMEINSILDPNQQAIYKQIKAERKEEMKKKHSDKKKMMEEFEEYQEVL